MRNTTITGKAKQDFRIGPDLFLRGILVTVPDEYADMVEQETITETETVQVVVPKVSPTVDDMIRNKIEMPKRIYNKKRGKK